MWKWKIYWPYKVKHSCNIIGIDGSEYALSRAKKLILMTYC